MTKFHIKTVFQVFAELNHITDSNLLDQKVQEFNKEVTELWDKLMALELQLVDQFEVQIIHLSHTLPPKDVLNEPYIFSVIL